MVELCGCVCMHGRSVHLVYSNAAAGCTLSTVCVDFLEDMLQCQCRIVNEQISDRRETALQGGSVLAKISVVDHTLHQM